MRSRFKWTLTFCISVALGSAALELFIKHAGVVSPIISYYHPSLGLYARPNLKWIKFKEGFFIGESYSRSRFGEDYPEEKPHDAFRVVLIGDSYVEGLDVFSRHHFRKVLESDLRQRTDRNVEVLNFGRGDSTLPFSYFLLNDQALKYDPDIILFFVEGRDREPGQWGGRTGYELLDGELVANYSWRESRNYRLFDWLAKKPIFDRIVDLSTLALVNRAANNIRLRTLSWIMFDKFHPLLFPSSDRASDDRLRASTDVPAVPIGKLTRRIMMELISLGKGGGGPEVLFVLRPLPSDPAPELEPALIEIGADYLDLGEIFEGGRGDILASSGIDAKYFKASGASGGHWNHEGHREVGHFLAEAIADRFE